MIKSNIEAQIVAKYQQRESILIEIKKIDSLIEGLKKTRNTLLEHESDLLYDIRELEDSIDEQNT